MRNFESKSGDLVRGAATEGAGFETTVGRSFTFGNTLNKAVLASATTDATISVADTCVATVKVCGAISRAGGGTSG